MIKLRTLMETNIEKVVYPLIKQSNGIYRQGNFDWHNFIVGKFYDGGDIQRYIHSQHHEFEDNFKIKDIYQLLMLNPTDIPESEWDVNDWKVEQLSKSTKEFPPIVIGKDLSIVDGGHRLAAAKLRGDKTIKVFKPL